MTKPKRISKELYKAASTYAKYRTPVALTSLQRVVTRLQDEQARDRKFHIRIAVKQ